MSLISKLNFDPQGLVPAVIQDDKTGKVLTLCYMNKEAVQRSFDDGKVYVYRRSKGQLMAKGETSGCVQIIKSVYVDCAYNSLLFKVKQVKAACHEGYFTCYFRKVDISGAEKIEGKKIFDPKDVYKT